MRLTDNPGRLAGLLYLLLTVMSIIPFAYVGTLIVSGNPTATAANVLANELSFRLSIVLELFAAIIFIPLVLTLYGLLGSVDRACSRLMVVFAVVSVPITFFQGLMQLAALEFIDGPSFLSILPQTQMSAVAQVFMDLGSQVLYLNDIFFGLWLLPFGILVYKSGFIPKVLGVLLLINGFAYLGYVTLLLIPSISSLLSEVLLVPELVGELPIMA
ncbi:MAG TPA: DUF4386 domain-containing protein, partial [Candidatus Bathyarchaeia archaeon]|nr:DUF4386 domain-containing protein [Candidatus Bathyarchaeia archaeon]